MKLSELHPPKGAIKKKKRVGRGSGSGHGKTSCRGHKGQKARVGAAVRPGFEGGQMPLIRRIPKRGFKNIFKKIYYLVKVGELEKFDKDGIVDFGNFLPNYNKYNGVKILSDGEITRPLIVRAHHFSQAAKAKIEAVGGKIEVIKIDRRI